MTNYLTFWTASFFCAIVSIIFFYRKPHVFFKKNSVNIEVLAV